MFGGDKMIHHIFSGCVQVEIQGPKVLRLLQRTIKFAEYEVVGFEDKVLIQDTRSRGLQAIDYLESSGDSSYFPEEFSSPAYAQIVRDNKGKLRIHLSDSFDSDLDFILWIAIGISNEIPLYDYQHQWIEYFDQDTIGMISIFLGTSDDGSDDSLGEEYSSESYVESVG